MLEHIRHHFIEELNHCSGVLTEREKLKLLVRVILRTKAQKRKGAHDMDDDASMLMEDQIYLQLEEADDETLAVWLAAVKALSEEASI